jgi:hypothetical protein
MTSAIHVSLFIRQSSFMLFGLFAIALVTGCAAPFADLQGARLAGKGRMQITPSFSTVSYSAPGESEELQREYTVQIAGGVTDNVELRARYTRIAPPGGSDGEGGINVIAAGPKFAVLPGRLAVGLPVGLAFGDGIEAIQTTQFHPTVFLTVPVGRNVEVNLSGKALLPNAAFAANLGLGLSTNLDRWAVRPEFGVLKYPDGEGYVKQASIGLTLNGGP